MKCPACPREKERVGAFVCHACWRLLPSELRRSLFATRYKPLAFARALSVVVAHAQQVRPMLSVTTPSTGSTEMEIEKEELRP